MSYKQTHNTQQINTLQTTFKNMPFLHQEGRLLNSSLASLRNERNVINKISLQFLSARLPFFLLLSAVL